MKKNYRIKITTPDLRNTYLVRRKGEVRYISSDEQELWLTNLVGTYYAAETRFLMEDVQEPAKAVDALREILTEHWKNQPESQPTVKLL